MKTRLYIIATLTVLLLTACGKKNDENVVRIAYLPITHALPLAGLE